MTNLMDSFESAEVIPTQFKLVKNTPRWVRIYPPGGAQMGTFINEALNKNRDNPHGDYPNVQFSIESGDWQKEGCSAFLRFVGNEDRQYKWMGSKWPRNSFSVGFLLKLLKVPNPKPGTVYVFMGDKLVWDPDNRIIELKFNPTIEHVVGEKV
jgi:hypothetical protein